MRGLLVVTDDFALARTFGQAVQQGQRVAVRFAARRASIRVWLQRLEPEVVVLDECGDRGPLAARIAEARTLRPNSLRVLLAAEMDAGSAVAAFNSGIQAIVSRDVEPASIGPLLRELARGHVALPPAGPRGVAAPVQRTDASLTSRELEILRLVAEGHTNASIGKDLWVTEQTVKFHLSNIYRKLGVVNRTQAGRYAVEHLLVDGLERLAS